MKNSSAYSEYKAFCIQRKKDLQRIARHSCGAHDLSDVEIEAWLMAEHMQNVKAIRIDWKNTQDQNLLLSYLYQHLLRYTERHLQFAIRLDHGIGDGMEDEPHPLLNKLAADNEADPLASLSAREEALQTELREPNCHHSLASAYVHLLRHFDNKMSEVANHLLISLSYCYRRYAQVLLLTELQISIPIHCAVSERLFFPGAWRRFRLRREPVQLAFDFGIEQHLAFI